MAIAVVLALIIRGNVMAFYVVDGSSMIPTLNDGQMVAVNKIVYNLKEPGYGDIIVFYTDRSGQQRELIKRVVALPGDTVLITDGKLYVNDQLVEERYIDFETGGDYGPRVIEPGELFVLGDNRRPAGSWDSRQFGPVQLTDIIGRADFIIFPMPGRVR